MTVSEARLCSWVVDSAQYFPATGRALDVACGRGRHALWLASHGYDTLAVDRNRVALDALAAEAERLRLPIQTHVHDLETGDVSLGQELFDVVIVVRYLHRPLFPSLVSALRPGGVLVYETFTTAHTPCRKPSNPAFLLQPGELPGLVAPLTLLAVREGCFDGDHIASVVARKT
jgi:SAM-dependent methyltransferase